MALSIGCHFWTTVLLNLVWRSPHVSKSGMGYSVALCVVLCADVCRLMCSMLRNAPYRLLNANGLKKSCARGYAVHFHRSRLADVHTSIKQKYSRHTTRTARPRECPRTHSIFGNGFSLSIGCALIL